MKRGDIIAALALLALAGALFGIRMLEAGKQVTVYVNGSQVSESVTVNGVTVEIDGNRARVADSPCRDGLCVRTGWLERPGDAAVCLPQRVIVEIRGLTRAGGADGLAG